MVPSLSLSDGVSVWQSAGDAGLPESLFPNPGGPHLLLPQPQLPGDPRAVQGTDRLEPGKTGHVFTVGSIKT